MSKTLWKIYLNDTFIDIVYFSGRCGIEEVRALLIRYWEFDPDIEIKRVMEIKY